jgi:hypothetical protein
LRGRISESSIEESQDFFSSLQITAVQNRHTKLQGMLKDVLA